MKKILFLLSLLLLLNPSQGQVIPLALKTYGNSYSQDIISPAPIITTGSNLCYFTGGQTVLQTGYDAASTTLFAAMSTPPNTFNKLIIDNLIRYLKTSPDLTKASNNWDELDVLVVLAQDSVQGTQAALLNWKNPGTYNATVVNSAVWTKKQGYSGSTSANNRYLRTNYIPSSNGSKYANGNCSMFVYNLNGFTNGTGILQEGIGSYDGTYAEQLFLKYTAPYYPVGVLHSTGLNPLVSTARNDGLICLTNKGDQIALSRNAVMLNFTSITALNTRSTRELYVLARNNQGTADLHATDGIIAVYGIGSAKIDQKLLYEAIQNYMEQLQTAVPR